jgi:DNA-binding NarL/FixJ family response regulator
VAELAATVASNREIAQALFVTVKTIEMHLGHAYRKLDIHSPRALAAALAKPQQTAIAAGASRGLRAPNEFVVEPVL